MSDRDELTAHERRALESWAPTAPSAGFADRVLAARGARPPGPGAAAVPAARRRWPLVATVLATTMAAATALLATRAHRIDHTAAGEVPGGPDRTSARLGDRGIAVVERDASLAWTIHADGAADVEQRTGDVFYRVEPGGPFSVHTPTGTVRVTGTCFRIQIRTPEDPMPLSKTSQLLASGALGAALATAVVITVYEGRVVAETAHGRSELAAGTRATIDGSLGTLVASADPTVGSGAAAGSSLDEATATREQALRFAALQRVENDRLRARVAALEGGPRGPGGVPFDDDPHDGRPSHDPSPETLKEWAKECRVEVDEPGYGRWTPESSLGRNERGLEPDELGPYNEALSEVQAKWKAFVRALYVEAPGDTAGADALSVDAMRNEITQKGSEDPSQQQRISQRIANEKAGLAAPPQDLTRLSPAERLLRAYVNLGDETEAALAKRLGAARAAAIRGDGWGSRFRVGGCPD